uniref:Uncharacterized protein n=1 Tax=Aegilops tauschii subsp. strangulata TaxID=200361 RepID=A0A452Z9B2_AEGTS
MALMKFVHICNLKLPDFFNGVPGRVTQQNQSSRTIEMAPLSRPTPLYFDSLQRSR